MKGKSIKLCGLDSKIKNIFIIIAIVIIVVVLFVCLNVNKKLANKESFDNDEDYSLLFNRINKCPKRLGSEVKWVCKDKTDENGNIIRSGCGCEYTSIDKKIIMK